MKEYRSTKSGTFRFPETPQQLRSQENTFDYFTGE